ncbi:hypothetical protein L3X38_023036 [Prunus dulcis]|uniref:RNase H type-1 domain-containing protein n=1 Tax=Prunus dulcis TaxID=3755 RepID=A0AAD4VZ27_PRUDU|nr:hypothetical protein L3X38_023036 [Prunus dulcis]
MRGFAVNLGAGQVLEAELWGIYLELKIAWDIGCSAVVLESDSATAVHLLNKKCGRPSSSCWKFILLIGAYTVKRPSFKSAKSQLAYSSKAFFASN